MAAVGLPIKIWPLQPEHWEWIRLRASPVLCQDTDGVVAMRGPDLVGAAIFDSFSENSCLSHVVIEDPMAIRAGLLYWGFHFVFDLRQLNLITGLTPADNEEALRFARKIGFRQTYRIPEGYKKGIDYVLSEMRKDECRWLQQKIKRAA